MSNAPIRIEINGRTATADQMQHPALVNYGHFTAMQVRDGRTRGLGLHLSRLEAATRELFDAGLDTDRVLHYLRHALAGTRDASVRISIFWPEADDTASTMVTIRPPANMPGTPQSLKTVPYQRPVPHIKHAGSFGQIHYGRLAERHGFDDALLTSSDGVISEGTTTNIAFYDGTTITWPDAPSLHGITQQLLEPRLPDSGLPTRRGPVHLADLPSFTAAFVTNSLGIAPVIRIDDTTIPLDPILIATVCHTYESAPKDTI